MARRRCGAMKKGRNLRILPPFPCHWASGAPPDWWPSIREGRAAPLPDRWAWVWWDPGPEPEKIASTFSDGDLTERPTSGHTQNTPTHQHHCTTTMHAHKHTRSRRANSRAHTHTHSYALNTRRRWGRGEQSRARGPISAAESAVSARERESERIKTKDEAHTERGECCVLCGCMCMSVWCMKKLPGTADGN